MSKKLNIIVVEHFNRERTLSMRRDSTCKTRLVSLEFESWRKSGKTFAHSLKHVSCLHFCSKLIPFSKPIEAPLRDHIPCLVIGDTVKSVVEITKKNNHISFCQLRSIFIRLIPIGLPVCQYLCISMHRCN